jgi:hypothetical protein
VGIVGRVVVHRLSGARRAVPAALLASTFAAIGCRGGESASDPQPQKGDSAPSLSAANSVPLVEASAPATVAVPPPSAPVPSAAAVALPGDASAAFCRVLQGPVALPIRGPATLIARPDRLDVVLDDNGRPRVVPFLAGSSAGTVAAAHEPADAGPTPMEGRSGRSLTPCAVAGEIAFCPDRTGGIHRASLSGEGDRIVASGRTGTRVAAALLAGGHAALAYLASRQTSEGWVSEAWLEVDDEVPLRLSEDGSGATAVELARRGGSLLALSIDARAALTAMHARPVAYDHGARLGEDQVVFVGGPGDRRTAASLVLPETGPGWALLPIARDMAEFGLAVVRLDDPPRVDEPVVWSMYPNGLDPAPVAASADGHRTWIARVRPEAAAPGAARVLELCEGTPEGTLTPRQVVPTAASPTDVSLALGPRAELWLSWVDASGSWIERLACR